MTKAELNKLIERRKKLEARISVLDTMDTNPTIQEIKQEHAEEIAQLDKAINEKREYVYNFVGGGWNSEHAHTVEEAIDKAKARWADTNPWYKIDIKSFRSNAAASYGVWIP
jgi:hypothetical protein